MGFFVLVESRRVRDDGLGDGRRRPTSILFGRPTSGYPVTQRLRGWRDVPRRRRHRTSSLAPPVPPSCGRIKHNTVQVPGTTSYGNNATVPRYYSIGRPGLVAVDASWS